MFALLGSLLLSCNSIEWWGFYGVLVGLALDLVGAALIVITDISFFDQLWKNEEQIEEAGQLQKAWHRLIGKESVDWDTADREVLMSAFRTRSDVDVRDCQEPDDIYAAPSNAIGTGGNVYIRYDSQSTNINEDFDKIGRTDLVNNWIDDRIEELEQTARDYFRGIGLILLLIGFSLQIVGYTIRNIETIATLLSKYSFCGVF